METLPPRECTPSAVVFSPLAIALLLTAVADPRQEGEHHEQAAFSLSPAPDPRLEERLTHRGDGGRVGAGSAQRCGFDRSGVARFERPAGAICSGSARGG
jgi:hypothetical protein